MNSISMKLIKTIEERIMHSCNIFLLMSYVIIYIHTFFYNCSNNISFKNNYCHYYYIDTSINFTEKKHFFTDVYPGQPPPPYDSQGETYHRLTADDEADTSPMDVIAEPLNSYRYPKARRNRHLGM